MSQPASNDKPQAQNSVESSAVLAGVFMNQCPLCGCSTSQEETSCPACFTSLQPRELTWPEMKARLIAAGWKEHEADEEIQSMQEDCESGM